MTTNETTERTEETRATEATSGLPEHVRSPFPQDWEDFVWASLSTMEVLAALHWLYALAMSSQITFYVPLGEKDRDGINDMGYWVAVAADAERELHKRHVGQEVINTFKLAQQVRRGIMPLWREKRWMELHQLNVLSSAELHGLEIDCKCYQCRHPNTDAYGCTKGTPRGDGDRAGGSEEMML